MKKIQMSLLASAAILITGCGGGATGDVINDGNNILNDPIQSGSVIEKSASNDVYTSAQTVGFVDHKFSISGTGNSSSDQNDWYVFTAPETGKYICGIDSAEGSTFTLKTYQGNHPDVSDNTASGTTYYEYSDPTDLDIYDEYGIAILTYPSTVTSWEYYPEENFEIPAGDKIYLNMIMESSSGNDAAYTIDCFDPTVYPSIIQSGTITENTTYPNNTIHIAHPVGMVNDALEIRNATLNYATDKDDYFKFTIVNGGTYNVTLNGSYGADIDVYIYGADKYEIASAKTSSSNENVSFGGLADGTYYVRVRSFNGYAPSGEYVNTDYNLTIGIQ